MGPPGKPAARLAVARAEPFITGFNGQAMTVFPAAAIAGVTSGTVRRRHSPTHCPARPVPVPLLVLLLGLAILPAALRGDDTPSSPGDEQKTEAPLPILDGPHAGIREGIRNLADWLDRFFGDAAVEEERQTTHLALKPTATWGTGGETGFSMPVRTHLVLPRLRRR